MTLIMILIHNVYRMGQIKTEMSQSFISKTNKAHQ